ncbi:DUF1963 domain-containing protein [Luteimonas sp. R10]|uniref:DUF1963 domain-containing protein n=1 Tax=Luteimonas sp. R10 TaxID=3108176 RepID=UPI00308840D1|nr:DUF1963 domain-containing protein [Luteimonas sp. R10]
MSEYEIRGWPADEEALGERLEQTGLPGAIRQALRATARPALMLATAPADEETFPLGATRIGGRPDLPSGFVWPTRSPYPDAREAAERELEDGAGIMASAGLPPPWMTSAKAKKLIEKTQRYRENLARDMERMREESRKKLAELETDDSYTDEEKQRYREMIEGEDFDLPPIPTREEAEAAGRYAAAKAEALTSDFPLAFVAQIDVTSFAGQAGFDPTLPRKGRLYLFYDLLGLPDSQDPASRTGFLVFHDETSAAKLVRTPLPPALAFLDAVVPEATLKPAAIKARSAATTTTLESLEGLGIRLRGRQLSSYDEWLLGEVGWPGEPEADRHQLGGWPRAVQSNMLAFAQFASNGIDPATMGDWKGKKAKAILADAGAWRLIFQLGPDEGVGNMLPGSVNFLLREEDLVARRFDRAWVVYEQS